MSMNFYLQSTDDSELKTRYPDVDMSLNELYPNMGDYFDEMSDTEHTQSGHFFTHDKGWCQTDSTVPTVNMSNSNMRYVLNEILGLGSDEYCGTLEDLIGARASCRLHTHSNCYYGITETLKLIELAIENNWSIYYA